MTDTSRTGAFKSAAVSFGAMFRRDRLGAKGETCDKCGTEKVYFVQHAHGNYPILDYVCPKCDLGGDQYIDWEKGGKTVQDE